MMKLEDFFKGKKLINGWAFTRKKKESTNKYSKGHPYDHDFQEVNGPGEMILFFNDPTSSSGRCREVFDASVYWYFYIDKTDMNLRFLQKNYKGSIQVGDKYIRVYYRKKYYGKENVELYELINKLHTEGIQTYEADLGTMKRICLDYDVPIEDWDKIRVLYFDIETDDSGEGIEIGRDRILSIAGVDRHGNEYYVSDPDEKKLLNEAIELFKRFDMLIGWNSKDFDIPYIAKRISENGLYSSYYHHILHEDMMRRVQYFYSKDPEARQKISSYSLESISQYFLGEGKVKHEEKIIELFHKNPQKLKEYNLQDCHLLRKLEEKLGLMELTYHLCQMCQVTAQNWSTVKTIDNFLLSDANKKGIHYKTDMNRFSDEMETGEERMEYLGAYVVDPVPGYYEKVYDLDFASLYPNIIRTFNISPDTMMPEHIAHLDFDVEKIHAPELEVDGKMHGGLYFYKDRVGIIPGKIGMLLEDRKKLKKQLKTLDKKSTEYRNLNVKQLVVKELANSIYGVLGNKYFREFSVDLAESITVTGQYLIRHLMEYFEEKGHKVIYGDTDSIFLVLGNDDPIEEVLAQANKDLEKYVEKEFNVNHSTLELELDATFDQFLIEAKKKYATKTGDDFKFVGMECVKRDTIPVAVHYQRKLIEKIFAGDDAKKIHKWIAEKKKTILEKDFKIEDITIRKKLNKNPDLYRSKVEGRTYTAPIHVRIAKRLSEKKTKGDKTTDYSAGSIIQYIITDGKGGKINQAAHISEFAGEWDREYYFENIVYPILYRVLITAFPEEDWDQYKIKKPRKRTKKAD